MRTLIGHENSKGTFNAGQNYHIIRGVYKKQKPLIIKYVFNSHSTKTALKGLPAFFKTVIKPLWLPALMKVWTNGAEEAEIFIKDWHGVKKIAKADYQDYADQFLADHGASKIDGITDTDQAWLANTLRSGVSEGLSTSDIASNLTDDFDNMSIGRAGTIARTETASAFNYASNETATDMMPDGATKTWNTTSENPRPAHDEADGQTVDINDSFDVGGEDLQFPGDPDGSPDNIINCMCVVSYEYPSESEVTGLPVEEFPEEENE
jgi:hypothetical protein